MNWSTHRNQTICHTCSCLVCTSFANPMHIAAEPKLAYNANSIGACMIYMCHKCMFHVNPLKGLSALESTREHQHLESMATSTPTAWSIRRGTSTRAWWSIRSVTKRLHHVQEARFELHGKTAQFKNRRSRRGLLNVVISVVIAGFGSWFTPAVVFAWRRSTPLPLLHQSSHIRQPPASPPWLARLVVFFNC